jgi:hypothetical protein
MNKWVVTGLLIVGLAAGSAVRAQQGADALKQQIVGTWLVTAQTVDVDGKRVERFGASPKGTFMFDSGGRFAAMLLRPDLPKFASNNAMTGTDEENKAVVQGSTSFYGTWSIPDSGGAVITRIVGSSYPNWDGVEQKRTLAIAGDELRMCVASMIGGTSCVVAKRAR